MLESGYQEPLFVKKTQDVTKADQLVTSIVAYAKEKG